MSLRLRPARAADAAALGALLRRSYAAAFGDGMSEADLAALAAGEQSDASMAAALAVDRVLVAERAGALVGFAQWGPAPEGVDLRRLYVAPEAQARGIGAALLDAALVAAGPATVTLDVWERNARALRLHLARGFVVTGARRPVFASGPAADADLILNRPGRGAGTAPAPGRDDLR